MYHRYYLGIVSGFVITALLWSGLFLAQLGMPTESSRWLHEVNTIQTGIARAVPSRKLVVVGGSNVLFGISTEMIEKETEIPSVNLGVSGSFGLDYILKRARTLAGRGDIVVLVLEYELYDDNGVPDRELVDYVLARHPEYWYSLSPFEQMRFVFSLEPRRAMTGIEARFHTPAPKGSGYQSRTLNANGDETSNLESNRVAAKVDGHKPNDTLMKPIRSDTRSWEELEEFARWCDANGVTLVATFPSTIYFREYDESVPEEFFEQISHFYSRIGVPVLGSPKDFMYEKSWFYDSIYHLTDRAMVTRTRQTIELLLPYTSKVFGRQN